MAQLDDIVGSRHEEARRTAASTDNTIVVFTTDNGAENFTWPDGGQTPFAGGKGTVLEGGFRVPCIAALAGQGAGGQGRERDHVRARLVPDVRGRGGQPEHRRGAQEGQAARRARPTRSTSTATTRLDLITGKGPSQAQRDLLLRRGARSARCASATTSTASSTSRAAGSAARSRSTGRSSRNLRLDPFERTGLTGSLEYVELVQVRVLALRLRPAGGGEVRPDLHRVPADAEAGARSTSKRSRSRSVRAMQAHHGQ